MQHNFVTNLPLVSVGLLADLHKILDFVFSVCYTVIGDSHNLSADRARRNGMKKTEKRIKMTAIRVFSALFALIFVFSAAGCGKSDEEKIRTAAYVDCFDTVSFIKGYADSGSEFDKYAEEFYGLLKYYNALYDIYNLADEPNLKSLNDAAGGGAVALSEDIIELLEFSKKIYTLTGGKTNIALGSVLKIWHEYREKGIADPENAALPSKEELADAALHTDIENIIIDRENMTAEITDALCSIDVGAVAKGFAAEKIAKKLREDGFVNGIISIGGNTVAIGGRDGGGWKLGIRDPEKDDSSYIEKVALTDMSVVTSGSYQRFYSVGGKNYHHIIDPDTLMPAEGFVSVSVVCGDSATADGLSTALFCMSLEEGTAVVNSLDGVYVLWVTADGKMIKSDGFDSFVSE